MATYTDNYNFKKPEETDFYSVQDFNDNMDDIDEELAKRVDFSVAQSLTNAQKTQARNNIGAAASTHNHNKSQAGLGNVDNVRQYSASNPPPYPVTSINGRTGAVIVQELTNNLTEEAEITDDDTVPFHDTSAEAQRKTAWSNIKAKLKTYFDTIYGTYTKPSGGIPASHLDSSTQTKIGQAHSHSNKSLLDLYTQTEANIADAVTKRHSHSNKSELDLIAAGDKAKWDAKYAKPASGIPKTDLASAVQISLEKADSALQTHQDISGKQDKTNNLTAETTIVDGDHFPFYDTSASAHRKTLWSNIKSVMKTYFDTLYATSNHNHDSRYYTEPEIDAKLNGKANSSHGHAQSDIAGLSYALSGKAPAYTYGTSALTPGVSPLATGTLYIQYEE